MPLREDLLTPIAGEKPAGEDLYYTKVYDQIKEARKEDAEDLPEGDWERSQKKKADHRAVIKLAGEALATKTKDIRLLGWLVESQLRVEGLSILGPGIDALKAMQEAFWNGLYPPIEEGNDLELRMISVEAAASLFLVAVRKVPLTRSGLTYEDYLQSRIIGYEKDATTEAKQEARQDAINRDRPTAEVFDQAVAATPKSFYVATESALAESLLATDRLDEFQREAYGDNAPILSRMRDGLDEVHRLVEMLLNERRKTEPDPVQVSEAPAPAAGAQEAAGGETEPVADGAAPGRASRPRPAMSGQLGEIADAYALVVESAEFLFGKDPASPVPYLVCAGLRLGETRMQDSSPAPGFAVGPGAEIRQSLRAMANKGEWNRLLRASLPILASECARTWLDLHRYIWRAGQETGATALSDAVVGTVKSLLAVRPELRHWTLEDDTGAANPETQQWLDATVLQ
jgi:type VI secretion system protein ImpA